MEVYATRVARIGNSLGYRAEIVVITSAICMTLWMQHTLLVVLLPSPAT